MSERSRLQFGSVIVEVIDNPESDHILLTVSKERYEDDHVQVALPRHGATAVGHLLIGEPK